MKRREFIILLGSAAITWPLAGFAQNRSSKTQLITLGTGAGPLPRRDRAQSSNLLIVNGANYLVDAGDGVVRRLVQAGVKCQDLSKIFITHHHDDHTAGLATVLSVAWDYRRTTPIDVYGPPGTEQLINSAVQYFTINAEVRWNQGRQNPLTDVFVGHDVGVGQVYEDANIKVTAVENTHFNFPKGTPAYGKFKSYSYRFHTSDRIVVFTGDTGPSEAVTELAKNADVLVSLATSVDDAQQMLTRAGFWQAMTSAGREAFLKHLIEENITPEEVGKMAASAGVKLVVLTHLASPQEKDDFQRYVDDVKKHFAGTVVAAKDLMEF